MTDDLDKPADEIGSYQKGPFEPEPYDGRKQEDDARRNIAYALIGLLFFTVIATFVIAWTSTCGIDDTIKLAQAILGPLVALVSAATGFYYGTKSK